MLKIPRLMRPARQHLDKQRRAAYDAIAASGLFDAAYYLESNPDVASAGVDPLFHFVEKGAGEYRNPSLSFAIKSYVNLFPDLLNSEQNPLQHYILRRSGKTKRGPALPVNFVRRKADLGPREQAEYDVVAASGLFHAAFYFEAYPDIAAAGGDALLDYMTRGALEGRDPNSDFSAETYLRVYPDLAISGQNPLYHYIVNKHGDELTNAIQEAKRAYNPVDHGRTRGEIYDAIAASGLFDSDFYRSTYLSSVSPNIDPLFHFLSIGADQGFDPNPQFSLEAYLTAHPDVQESGQNALHHYVVYGRSEGRAVFWVDENARVRERDLTLIRESALFDGEWYKKTNADIGDVDPAAHFIDIGGSQGRNPSAFFDTGAYLAANTDVAIAGLNALVHWLRNGRFENREIPVREHNRRKPTLTLFELCDPYRQEDHQSVPVDLRFSILTPTFNTDPTWLRELYQTIRNQTYGGWEWVICDDRSSRSDTLNTLREMAANDSRVVLAPAGAQSGISSATNAALSYASGEYVALVDHDDLLARNVFANVRRAVQQSTVAPDIVYTDECKVSLENEIYDIFLKPGWSPTLLQNTMYIGHLTLYKADTIRQLGGLRREFDGTQDYDLALRAARIVQFVLHVPFIGYLWRAVPGSTAMSLSEKSYALERQKIALQEVARERCPDAAVHPSFSPGYWKVNYPIPKTRPLLSYVIPTAAGKRIVRGREIDLIANCIESLESTGFYDEAEFVVVHNGDLSRAQLDFLSQRRSVVLVEYASVDFNLARKINLGVHSASGDYVCLLNDDVEAITQRGGDQLVGFLEASPEVGVVAPFCVFEDGGSQHNGVMLLEQGPSHAGMFQRPTFGGHAGFLRCRREVFAVTGAILFCRRSLFLGLGGFDECFSLNYNDVDFCLRVRASGLSCVVDPDVQVFHFESASKTGTYRPEKERLYARWPGLRDPYFNPGFDQRDPSFTLALAYSKSTPLWDAIAFEHWLDLRISHGRGTNSGDVFFSVCVPIFNQPPSFLNEMMASVLMQTWPHRELVLVDDASTRADTRAWLDRLPSQAGVTIVRLAKNVGIVGAQRHFLSRARGEFIIPLDADDFLTVDALAVFAAAVAANPTADVFYSDEFKSNPTSEKFAPFFKTDFDPVVIGNCCFTCHAMALRVSFMRRIDGYGDKRATWCHDWDTTFRALSHGCEPVHVPELLYAWRINPGSTASAETDAKPEAAASQRFVLERALDERGLTARLSVEPNPLWPKSGMWSLKAHQTVDHVAVLDAAAVWGGSDPHQVFSEVQGDAAWIAILLSTRQPDVEDALLKLSAVAIWEPRVGVVSGALSQNDGARVLWAGGLFTRKGVFDPFHGASWLDGGYYGRLYGQRCVDVAAPVNVMMRREHLQDGLALLKELKCPVTPSSLMISLGREATNKRWLVAITPLLRADLPDDKRMLVPIDRDAVALAGPNPILVSRWYGSHLDPERAFQPSEVNSAGWLHQTKG